MYKKDLVKQSNTHVAEKQCSVYCLHIVIFIEKIRFTIKYALFLNYPVCCYKLLHWVSREVWHN